MRRTQAEQFGQLGQYDDMPVLAEITCRRCPTVGVTIVAMGTNANGAVEMAWCGPKCAALDGWPWLRSKRDAARDAERNPQQVELFAGPCAWGIN